MGAPMPFARNTEIYGENEPSEYLYKVLTGTVRTYKVLNDGRRQNDLASDLVKQSTRGKRRGGDTDAGGYQRRRDKDCLHG